MVDTNEYSCELHWLKVVIGENRPALVERYSVIYHQDKNQTGCLFSAQAKIVAVWLDSFHVSATFTSLARSDRSFR